MASTHDAARSWARLGRLLRRNAQDLGALVVHTALSGLLTLAVPLAAQALVNTIASGVLLQPLVVLSVCVLAGLLLKGLLGLLELSLVEGMRQRFFAEAALELAGRLPRLKRVDEDPGRLARLATRFFEIPAIQKSWAKLLVDGPAAAFQVLLGLLVLSFYSPWLLGFGLALGLAVLGVVVVLGRGGLETGLAASAAKYEVADWIDGLARLTPGLRLPWPRAGEPLPRYLSIADDRVGAYLDARQEHFRVLFRQAAGWVLVDALFGAGLLALGGWLVLKGELGLGQLVAAELLLGGVLAAARKLVRLIEPMLTLLTGLEKLGTLMDLEAEPDEGLPLVPAQDLPALRTEALVHRHGDLPPWLDGLELSVGAGEVVLVDVPAGRGRTTLARLLVGELDPTSGNVRSHGVDLKGADPKDRHRLIALLCSRADLIDGTLEDNLLLGAPSDVTPDLRPVIRAVGLDALVARQHLGTKVWIGPAGAGVSESEAVRIAIARILLERPRVVVVDDALSHFAPDEGRRLADLLADLGDTAVVHLGDPCGLKDRVDRVIVPPGLVPGGGAP